jgi:serine/threonine protein kinase
MRLRAISASGDAETIAIDETQKIGEGATARIYRILFKNEVWAAKIYKEGSLPDIAKLKAMLHAPPPKVAKARFTLTDGEEKFIQYTWVSYLLMQGDGGIAGFIMPFVDQQLANSLDTYYDPVLLKRLKGSEQSALSLRIEIARNLCELVSNLHSLGHYFIDIKPQNIRVYDTSKKVVLMDCDGFSIKNPSTPPERFPAALISTDYIAPEVLKNNLSPNSLGEEQDRYGLAVILFQLLNRGTHPFQGIVIDPRIQVSTNDERAALGLYPHHIQGNPSVKPRPQSMHAMLLRETRELFDRAFTSPRSRPSASEWTHHFDGILEKKLLVRCSRHPSDVRHIHFRDKECMGCKIDADTQVARSEVKAPRTYTIPQPSGPQPSQANYTSAQSSAPPVSTPTKDTSPVIFWGLAALLAFFIIGGYDSTKQSTTQSSTPPSIANVESGSSCSAAWLSSMSIGELCSTYWTNAAPKCDERLIRELVERGVSVGHPGSCGTPIQVAAAPNTKTAANANTAQTGSSAGFVSVYISQNRGAGWSSGAQSRRDAEVMAKDNCTKFAVDGNTCSKWFTEKAKCVGVARDSNGVFGAAFGDNETGVGKLAINHCRESGGSDCTLAGTSCD